MRLRPVQVPRTRRTPALRTQQIWAGACLLVAALTLVSWPTPIGPRLLPIGEIQPTTIVAEMDFPVLKDPEELARERERELESVPAVVVRDDSASVVAGERLVWVRDQVRQLRERHPGGSEFERGELVLAFSQPTLIALLLGPKTDDLFTQAEHLLQDVMLRGYVEPDLAAELATYSAVRIVDPVGSVTVPGDQVVTSDRVREFAKARAAARRLPDQALAEIVLYCALPNLRLATGDTEALKQQAVATVEPHTSIVQRGEKIIGAHERITPEVWRKLRSYEYWLGQEGHRIALANRLLPILGDILLALALVGAFVAYLLLHRRSLLEKPHDFWLLLIIVASHLLLAAIVVRALDLPSLLVPVSAVSILVALFFDTRIAVAASLFVVFTIGLVADGGTLFVGVVGVGTIVAVLLTPSLRRRSHFYRILGVIAGTHLVMLAGLSLADGGQVQLFLRSAVSAAANPVLVTLVVLGFLPISEILFHRSTDLSLVELADLNQPLLRRLMMEAPGTYHHSLMVGTIGETAAQRIGANPLLTRVIGYYHDIGKVTKPEHYQENVQMGRRAPLDKLAPSMSRLLLERHLREGVALAQEARLPREVLQGIREHHGTSVMSDVLERARASDPAATVEAYSYSGPRPSTRESALVLLANEIDARARSLEEAGPSRIKRLVHDVVRENLDNGNLDGSGLSLSDLAAVREVYTSLLSVAYRARTDAKRSSGTAKRPAETRGNDAISP